MNLFGVFGINQDIIEIYYYKKIQFLQKDLNNIILKINC